MNSATPNPRQRPASAGSRGRELGPCPRCGKTVVWNGRGRKPRWCCPTCRQRAKEARRTARNNEQPLAVTDGPAKPANTAEWIALLTNPQNQSLLHHVLAGVADHYRNRGLVPPVVDDAIETMLALPTGSGRQLRAGLPLPDADQRHHTGQQHTTQQHTHPAAHPAGYRTGYETGYAAGYRAAHTQPISPTATAPHPNTGGTQPVLSRQQRRAAQRSGKHPHDT